MAIRRNPGFARRNDRCPCGSGKKFKSCCSPTAPDPRSRVGVRRINSIQDSGESPVRWVITDNTTTRFFADKDNRIIVFKNQAEAIAIATLEDFQDQDPGDINVAGVGETRWANLQSKLPFVEIENIEQAVALVRERIETARAGLETAAAENTPTELNDAPQESGSEDPSSEVKQQEEAAQ